MRRAGALCLVATGAFLFTVPRIAWTEAPPQFLGMWGTTGSGPGQLSSPSGIAVDAAGLVYVTDQNNSRVCKFTSTGQFILAWGSVGSGPGQFHSPTELTIDNAGQILVVDYGNNRVQVFTPDGQFLSQFGTSGAGQLLLPRDVAVGPVFTYVADWGHNRIAYYYNGNYQGAFGQNQLYLPTGIASDPSGFVCVSDEGYNDLAIFSPTGDFIRRWGAVGQQPGQLAGPGGLDTDRDGNIFVADHGNSRVQKFTPGGTLLSYLGNTWDIAWPVQRHLGRSGRARRNDLRQRRGERSSAEVWIRHHIRHGQELGRHEGSLPESCQR